MCGICGVVHFDGRPIAQNQIAAMTAALVHRGPDDEGTYFNAAQAAQQIPLVGFGFRRLAIIDVSPAGHQPMRYKHLVLVFNGEIYNFRELRAECEAKGDRFTSHSDTEVLLHLFEHYGEQCLAKLNGMFALAIWNEATGELFLARDRLGIKPLYYYAGPQTFGFASEIKALLKSGEVPFQFDEAGVFDFFSYRFVPGPHTILKDVRKVRPGYFMRVRDGDIREAAYWTLALNAVPPKISFARAEAELTALLEDSVRLQMVSDVPLGAFLSGGVDSCLITALMCRHAPGRIKTFAIGFEKGTGVDESAYARQVAQFLGAEHHELILTAQDLLQTDAFFAAMTEPVADPTILPTAILSRFARQHVKVALTGEGGDELFAGYNRYKAVMQSAWVQKLPGCLQGAAAGILRASGKGKAFKQIPKITPQNWFLCQRNFAPETLAPLFNFDIARLSGYLLAHAASFAAPPGVEPLNAILELERQTALVDQLLMKVDMAAMGQSLEARPPYLDHRVVEFALTQIPARYKIKFFKGKYLLRKVAAQFLPPAICWRRKHGFIVPLGQWFGLHTREWLTAVLENPQLDALGLFKRATIQHTVANLALRREAPESLQLWPLVVLSCWLKSVQEK